MWDGSIESVLRPYIKISLQVYASFMMLSKVQLNEVEIFFSKERFYELGLKISKLHCCVMSRHILAIPPDV